MTLELKMDESVYSDLLRELECPICTAYMAPPIRQCSTGHSICEKCRRKLPKCPLCQGKFTEAKNLTLEALATKMHYPCEHKDSGCTAKLAFDERERHEAVCMFRGFKCALERCPWMGKLGEIEQHWGEKKSASRPYGINSVCHFKLKPEFTFVNLVKAYNQLFWFKCKTVMGNTFWAVQFIGGSDDADNYCYQVDIVKPGASKCKVILSDYCQSIETSDQEMFQEGNCVSLSLDALRRFTGDDEVLVYYVRVNELKEEKKEDERGRQQQQKNTGGGGGKEKPKQRDRSKNLPHSGKKFSLPKEKNN